MKNDLKQKNEYYLDESTSKALSSNKDYVKKCIKKWGSSQIDYATCEIDCDMIEFLISLGYTLSSFSTDKIRGNKDYVKLFIEAYGGNQLDFATCELDKELIDFACSYDLVVDATNVDNYTNVNLDNELNIILEGKDNSYKESINKIKKQTNSFLVYYLKDNSLLNEKIIKEFGSDLIIRCIKYLYLTGEDINLEELLDNDNLNCFKFIFTNILDKSFLDISVLEFFSILKFYSLYSDLIKDIMKNKINLSEDEKNKIITLFKIKDKRFEIETLDDLNNITNKIIIENKKVIKSNDIWFMREAIYLTYFNLSFEDISKLRDEYQINIEKINRLSNVIKDSKIKSILNNYFLLLEIVDFIENCLDIEVLKELLNRANNSLLKDNNYFKESHNLFDNIIHNIKYFYGIEIFEKMNCNLDKDTEYEEKEILKDDKKIKYLNVFSNQYYFQHTLNLYGEGSKLSDFKNSRLVGKTYICLSLIDNNHKVKNTKSAMDIDHVTLLFDKLPPTSLCVFSNCDINSDASNNSLDIMYEYANFDTVESILDKTNVYNEYVYYRENNDGKFIYPSGVLVTGDEPNQAEIESASYLGVPLIKLNPIKEKVREESTDKDKIDKNQNLIKELKSMKEYILSLNIFNKDSIKNTSKKNH